MGKILSITNASGADLSNLASNSAVLNPFRYRGYYYDNESGFYYLQSRYYDPSIGRFINADRYASTGQDFIGYNMFAYCNNNPIIGSDPTGKFVIATLLIVGGAALAVGAGTGAYIAACDGGDTGDIIEGAIEGGLTGLASALIGFLMPETVVIAGISIPGVVAAGAAGAVAGAAIDCGVQAGSYAFENDSLVGFVPDGKRVVKTALTTGASAMVPMFDGFSEDIGIAIGTAIFSADISFIIATVVNVAHQVMGKAQTIIQKKGQTKTRKKGQATMCVS